jgi:hypothetical protein
MSIAAVNSTSPIVTPSTTGASTTTASNNSNGSVTTPADSATISAAAQQASDAGTTALAQFESALKQVRSKLNAYEHRVTWQLDHKTAVTGPAGTATSNVSGGAATSATAGSQVINTQTTSAIASAVSLQISGSLGTEQLSFASGTKLSAITNAVNGVASATGVSAATSGASLKFNPSTSSNQFVSVSAVQGTFNTTGGTLLDANEQTIANGISSLKSGLTIPDTSLLSSDQQTQLNADYNKLTAEQTRFQNFVAHRSTPDYTDATRQLRSKVNAFEHQVTWQIDHNAAVTAPINQSASNASNASTTTTANTSTGTTSTATPADTTIAAGFASLEADASKALGSLSSQLASQFAQLKQTLATEQTRFAGFAASRSAYRTAHPITGAAQDVAA